MLQSISFLPRGCLFLIHQRKKPGGLSLQPGQRCLGCRSPAAALRSPKRCPHALAVKQIKSPRTPVAQFPPIQLWESGFSRRKPQESNLEKTPKSHPPPNPLPAPEETGKPGEIPFPAVIRARRQPRGLPREQRTQAETDIRHQKKFPLPCRGGWGGAGR